MTRAPSSSGAEDARPGPFARALQVTLNLPCADLTDIAIGDVLARAGAGSLERHLRPLSRRERVRRWFHPTVPAPVSDLLRHVGRALSQCGVQMGAGTHVGEIERGLGHVDEWLRPARRPFEITLPFWSPLEGDNLGLTRELCQRVEWAWGETVAGYRRNAAVPERHLRVVSRDVAARLQVPWGFLRPEDLLEDDSNWELSLETSYVILDELGIARGAAVDACFALWPGELCDVPGCAWPQDSLGDMVAFLSWWWSEVESLGLHLPLAEGQGPA